MLNIIKKYKNRRQMLIKNITLLQTLSERIYLSIGVSLFNYLFLCNKLSHFSRLLFGCGSIVINNFQNSGGTVRISTFSYFYYLRSFENNEFKKELKLHKNKNEILITPTYYKQKSMVVHKILTENELIIKEIIE